MFKGILHWLVLIAMIVVWGLAAAGSSCPHSELLQKASSVIAAYAVFAAVLLLGNGLYQKSLKRVLISLGWALVYAVTAFAGMFYVVFDVKYCGTF